MISRKGTQFFRNVAHEPIAYVKAVDGVDLAEAAAVHQKNCAAFSIPACNCSAVVQGSKDQRNQAMAMAQGLSLMVLCMAADLRNPGEQNVVMVTTQCSFARVFSIYPQNPAPSAS